jgi:Leucine-rich repeat (LRR) protein
MTVPIEIQDKNLKLALIEALIDLGRVPRLSKERLRQLNKEYAQEWDGGRYIDEEEEGEEEKIVSEVGCKTANDWIEQEYLDISVSEEDLLAITELFWGPTGSLIYEIFTYWDGEDDYFTLESLQGIEHCRHLKTLTIDSLGEIADLTPLAGLEALEEIDICCLKTGDITSLEHLPNLKRLHLDWSPEWKSQISPAVFATLAQREHLEISSNVL